MTFKTNLLSFLLLFVATFSFGQEINETVFSSIFSKSSVFDTVKVVNYLYSDDGVTVYLNMRNRRHVPDMEHELRATNNGVARLKFNNSLELVDKDFIFYNASSDTAEERIEKAFPGYYDRPEREKADPKPDVYYNNSIRYKFNQRPKKFVQKTLTKKKKVSKVGSFMGIASTHDVAKDDIDFEDFNGSGKKEYWMNSTGLMTGSTGDARNGNVYGLHGLYSKDKAKKDNQYRQFEFWAVNKEGKMINKSAANFSKPNFLQIAQFDFGGKIGLADADFERGIFIFSELEGKRYPGGDSHKFETYIFDQEGKAVNNFAFATENSATDLKAYARHGEAFSVFGVSPKGEFLNVAMTPKGVDETQSITEGDEMYKRFIFKAKELSGKTFGNPVIVNTAAGKVVAYEITERVSASAGASSQLTYSGTSVLYFDASGKLINAGGVKNTEGFNNRRQSGLYNLSKDDTNTIFAFTHPVKNGAMTDYFAEIKVIAADKPMTEIFETELIDRSAIIQNTENGQVFFIAPAGMHEYKMVRVNY